MPLTRYQIRNEYSLADPELYKAADRDDPEALLEGVAMAGLVGVLRQLGDLAEFASEIFHDLHEEVMATATRGHGLMVRAQQLEAEVPLIEKAFLAQTNFTPFHANAGVCWHPNLRTDQNLITRGDLPRCVMDSYEECRGPPQLFLLDKFDVAGAGACLKRYTDPSFFKVETPPSAPTIEAKRERKSRKVKKKGSRWKNGETPEIVPTSHAKLHQLFLEESVEKGRCDPARLVKLKKRQLNASPFDSRSGKSYMEKFLETPPKRNEVREISVSPLPLKLTSDNSDESGLEINDIVTVSPGNETCQDKEITCSSPNACEVLKPSIDELYGEVSDKMIAKSPDPSAYGYGEKEEICSIHHKVMDEKEIVVDGEGKLEGSLVGDNSDDLTSEVENYSDALTTMESEMETDHEYRLKSDIDFSNVEKCGTDTGRKGERLEFEAHSSDSQSIENIAASDDGNSSFKKGRSRFYYSDTLSNLAEITQFDGEGSAIVLPTSEAFISKNAETPSYLLPLEVADLCTKSHDPMLPGDMCIDEDNICSLGEVSCNSLADSNHPLAPLNPSTSSFENQSDETPSESMKLCVALSYSDERETNLADSSAVLSDMHSQTSDDTPFAVSSESHSVDKLDGGDPDVSSDDLVHLSNDSDLAPEKKSVDDSPDEALHIDFAEESYPDNAVNIKFASPGSNTSPKEEEVRYSVLSEVEGSYVEKHGDLVSDIGDALPETEVYQENSISMGNASHDFSFKEQHLSDIVDNVPQVDLESAEETALKSEEANIADTSGTADSEKRGASTCKVDAVDLPAVSLGLPSSYTDDAVAESVQAENMAVSFTATDSLPAEASAHDDVDVVSHDFSFKEQHLSDIVDNVPQVDLESAEETALKSEEANIADTSGTADSEKRGASTCKVDAVDLPAVSLGLPSSYMDDAVAESVQAENMAVSFTATDSLPAEASAHDDVDVVCPLQELACSSSKDTVNSGSEDPRKDGLDCNELDYPECLTGPEAENKTTEMDVAPKDVKYASCNLIYRDECNSEMVNGVQNSLADVTQNSLPAGDVSIPYMASGLGDQEPESKSFHQSRLLDGGQGAMSSVAVPLPDPGTSSEKLLEFEADQLDVECMNPESNSNSPNHISDQMQSSNHTDQEHLLNDYSESCQEDLSSEPSPSGYSQQTSGQEISNTEQKMDSSSSVLPSFGLLYKAAQVNLEEMPPLPPLPPMQWRLGKIQHVPLVPPREFMDSPESSLSILPFRNLEKAQPAFPAIQNDIVQPANPFLSVNSLEVEMPQHVSEQVDNVMQSSLSSLQFPFMANDADIETTTHGLEGTQSLNTFLTLSALPDEKPEHGFLASENEVVQSSSNPFFSLPAVEDTASKYDPVSSSEKLIHSLNHSTSGLPYATEDVEEEYGNPSDTSVLQPREVEDTASKYYHVSSSEKPTHSLNQSASEPGLQHSSENFEGEHGNPSDMPMLPPTKVEDTACAYGSVSSLEKPIQSLNQSASEPALPNVSKNLKEEHAYTSDASVPPPRKVEEQPQHDLPRSEGEPAWPFNSFALLATSELGQVNGSSIVKLPRPRNPLIDAVAAHDKSKLRKVTERVQSEIEPKVDERNSLLEQIRTKSFNLKPAVVSRTSIQGPKTNLRVAAILEKANAIRQATAGSDEDDDEDWSDS